ncbi:hypothetical protein NPIL_620901 [Nephila pilipes]|uniref:Uncharacterized protein n=1 Tax=Nephila pilipes TaxID=299642 RepID=A0A8X6QA18_NEPPI|nr:hypothetical protein NPIL_620901 [Nephila pilipes]
MAKSEASAQRDNGNPDFGKEYRAALARSDLHCSKFFIVPSVHGTFLRSFFFAPFTRSCSPKNVMNRWVQLMDGIKHFVIVCGWLESIRSLSKYVYFFFFENFTTLIFLQGMKHSISVEK